MKRIRNFIIVGVVVIALIFGISAAKAAIDILWFLVGLTLFIVGGLGIIDAPTKKHDKRTTIMGSLILIIISIKKQL